MKKWIILIGLVCMAATMPCLGLTLAEQAIQDAANQIEYQLTDPNSDMQQIAEGLKQLVGPLKALVQRPGFPYAKVIVGVLSIISVLLNIILGWRKKITDTALTEVVKGGQNFKKIADNPLITEFKQTQAAAQSRSTKKLVASIKAKV